MLLAHTCEISLVTEGQEAFTRAISLWERGLGQVSETQGRQRVHPQLATRLRNILRHAYTVQDIYEHIRYVIYHGNQIPLSYSINLVWPDPFHVVITCIMSGSL